MKVGLRFWLNLFLLIVLAGSPAVTALTPQPAFASPLEQAMLAAGVRAPLSGPAAEVGQVVAGPQVRAGMDDPAPVEKAVATDQRIPAWETRFNTRAGLEFMEPQGPPAGLSPQGAVVEVGGWRSYDFGGTNNIAGIAAAPDGRVFVGVRDVGLKMFYHNPDGTNAWTTISASPGGLVSNSISDVAVSGDLLWVGTNGFGISVLNLVSNTWSTYTTSNTDLPSTVIHRITAIPSTSGYEEFYAATSNGSWHWLNDPYGASSLAELVGYNVNQVMYQVIGGTRVEWFATTNELWRWNGAWQVVAGGGTCSNMDSAYAMAADGQNGMWFAAYEVTPASATPAAESEAGSALSEAPQAIFPIGVCRYYQGAWTRYTAAAPGLPSDLAADLQVDRDGRIWMAFEDYNNLFGGAAVWDQGTWLIFKKQYGDPLAANPVSFAAPAGESVWFGYLGKSAVTQYSNNWADFGAAQTGGSGSVTSVLLDPSETYVGRGTGVVYHNGTTWINRPIPGNTSSISRMARLNSLWVATRGSGIYEYDGTSFLPHTSADGLASDDVRDLIVDAGFRMWAATAGGLSLRTNGYWLNFSTANSPLGSNDLTALAEGNDGRIWIGTNGDGAYLLNPGAEAGANGAPAGDPAWTHLTSADGLPGDVISGFAVQPNGTVWAISPTGQAYRDPLTGAWTRTGDENSTAIASDPSGRIWLGTPSGLRRWSGNTWSLYLTNSSLLDSNWIRAVASDGLRTWVASGGNVQARADFNGPIGFFPPVISSFTPASAGVDDTVTIFGSSFDARRASNNTVSFGNLSDPTTYGDVTSATASSLSVKVPLLARSGKIWVRANRLNAASAADFIVLPKIRSLSPTCTAMGGELTIEGSGFNSGSEAAYIKVGGGPWRFADAQTPTGLRYRLRPGDTDGTVSVRLGAAGQIVTSSQSVTIDVPVIDQVGIQQAIQGLPLVWAKRTLILLSMRSSRGLCSTRIDGGQLEFKLKDGTTRLDWQSYQPTAAGLTVGPVAPPLGVNTSLSFVMWSQALSRPDFAVTDFNGVRLHLFSGPVEVVTYDIPLSSFYFTDMNGRRTFLNAYLYNTAQTTNADWDSFYRNAEKGLDHVARVYPQSDLGAYYGRDKWLHWAWRTIGWTGLIDLASDDTFHTIQGKMEDIRSSANDNGGAYDQGMAIIEASLQSGSTAGKATYSCSNPFGDCDQPSAAAVNLNDDLAGVFMQEAIHTMHWIEDSSPNHDGGNETHSRYNNVAGGNCTPAITFRQALVDQLGYAARAVRIEYAKAPYQFLYADCSAGQMPVSVMSYAPGSQDNNVFLEPLDYFYVFNNVRIFGQAAAEPGLSGLPGLPTLPQTHQELRLNGEISGGEDHTVTISMSYLDDPGGKLTQPTPNAPYQLVVRDSGGAALLEFPFDVGAVHTHGAPEKDHRFGLRVAFPDGAASAAIVHEGQEIWSSPVSAGAPSVSFTSPVQYQSYNATDPLPVAWDASDPDGDSLSFILEYSPDDGLTWQTIATGLSGGAYDWTPTFAPVGTSRLRFTASDGFNTGQAVSEIFYIQPTNPVAIIQEPADGTIILEGGLVTALGGAIASESGDLVQYDWYFDGEYFGSGQFQGGTTTDIGTHTLGLQVIANGLPSEVVTATIHVVPDYDHDGLSNDYEQAYGINPLDRSDSAADPDDDGLQTLEEQQIGSSPISSDSDGDGITDGDELALGGSPVDPNSLPSTSPVLQVGAASFGFVYRQGDPAPDPWSIWVTNGGGGALDWSAQSSAAWLTAGPLSGSAPGELLVSADPSGLPPGEYFASLAVTAPGTAGSPQSINVFLRVYDANGGISHRLYLPMMRR